MTDLEHKTRNGSLDPNDERVGRNKAIMPGIAILIALLLLSGPALAQTPAIVSPPPGHIMTAQAFGDGALVEFQWRDFGAEVTDWALFVGSTIGADDIQRITHLNARYPEDQPETQSLIVGIPANGETFYVRFWWYQQGWHFEDIEYIAPDLQ